MAEVLALEALAAGLALEVVVSGWGTAARMMMPPLAKVGKFALDSAKAGAVAAFGLGANSRASSWRVKVPENVRRKAF